LIAMCGLPFSGKSVLASALSRELRIRLLSYDYELYPVHSRRAPAGSSVAAEYDFVADIARREIGEILAGGESLIYDDLLLQREHRRKLAAVAQAHWTELVLVYLDTPLPVIEERRAANSGTRARTSVPEGKMRQDIVLLEPPEDAERPIRVSPGYVLPEVLVQVSARLRKT
jgi:predicted kinase